MPSRREKHHTYQTAVRSAPRSPGASNPDELGDLPRFQSARPPSFPAQFCTTTDMANRGYDVVVDVDADGDLGHTDLQQDNLEFHTSSMLKAQNIEPIQC